MAHLNKMKQLIIYENQVYQKFRLSFINLIALTAYSFEVLLAFNDQIDSKAWQKESEIDDHKAFFVKKLSNLKS